MVTADILVLHYNMGSIGGDFFDDYEYFCFLRQIFPELAIEMLVIADNPYLVSLLSLKYDNTVPYIHCMTHREFLTKKFLNYDVNLIFGTASTGVFSFLTELRRRDRVFKFNKVVTYVNGTYEAHKNWKTSEVIKLGDYRSRDYYRGSIDIDVRRGLYFDILKKPNETPAKATLVNGYSNHKKISVDILEDCITSFDLEYLLIVGLHKIKTSIPTVCLPPPVYNLFDMVDSYLYIIPQRGWDTSPRLIAECVYFGKKVYYYNHLGVTDGSYYRYQDCMEDLNSIDIKNTGIRQVITNVL